MNMNTLFVGRPEARFAFGSNEGGMSGEVSALLLRAVTCVEQDETNALDLIRRASSLLRPRAVQREKKLMLEGNAPLCEIALDCGLADQAHLSRIFRNKTGTTPSAWRRYAHQMARERVHAGLE